MRPRHRAALTCLAAILLVAGAVVSVVRVGAFERRGLIGIDYRLMVELGERWRETGSMYAAYQLAGPYAFDRAAGTTDVAAMPGLYPPIAGPVFAAVGLLPAVLWWLVPLGLIAYALYRWRPAAWSWPLLAVVLVLPLPGPGYPAAVVAVGGTTMWMTAAVAGGLLWGWPALLVALKPSVAPFLLVGARRRSWYIGLVAVAGMSLLFLPEWLRYVAVVRNAVGAGFAYSVADLPLLLAPVLAWAARTAGRSIAASRPVTAQPALRPLIQRPSASDSHSVPPPEGSGQTRRAPLSHPRSTSSGRRWRGDQGE